MTDLVPSSPKRSKRSRTHSNKGQQNGHSEPVTVDEPGLSALCGCGKCTVSTFLKTGCSKPSPVLLEALPNLDIDGLSDSSRLIRAGKLYLEHQQLCGSFSALQSSVWKSITDRRIPIESVSTILQSVRVFQPPHAHIPLFTRRPSTIKETTRSFSLLTSFFNHSLLIVLVNELGTDSDKSNWERYKTQFNEYSNRNILECPSYHGSEVQPDSCELVLKVDDSFTKLTIAQLYVFIDWLSAFLLISRPAIKLVNVSKKENCHVEMVYPQLSKEVELICCLTTVIKEEVFPVSPEHEEMLRTAGVLEIHCGDVHQVLTTVPQSSALPLSGEHPNTEYFNNLTMAQAAMLLNPPHTVHDQTDHPPKNGHPHDAILRAPGYGDGYLGAPSSNVVYSQSDLASQFLTSRADGPGTSSRDEQASAEGVVSEVSESEEDADKPKPKPAPGKKTRGRVKIPMKYIKNKLRRYTTFSKRKSNIMKKAYELSTLTGTQVMLMVASETGHVYTFATPKLQPMITSEAGKALIQTCLHQPDPQPSATVATPTSVTPEQFDVRMSSAGYEEVDLGAYKQQLGGTEETKREKAPPPSLLAPSFPPDIAALMPVLSTLRPQPPLSLPSGDYTLLKESNRKA